MSERGNFYSCFFPVLSIRFVVNLSGLFIYNIGNRNSYSSKRSESSSECRTYILSLDIYATGDFIHGSLLSVL
nr:MAG TPA: hypothetical protein [Caudoviricetes sp.]